MKTVVSRAFTLEVDARPTLVYEARNQMEARELCKELWFDLSSQMSNGIPLCDANSKLSARAATADEARLFDAAARATANVSDDLVLAYLVELDC
jgi:hypothetical protein